MQPLIEDTPIKDNDNCIIANVTGATTKPYEASHLIAQIDKPVLWSKTLACAETQEVECFIELGPQKVLSSLAKKVVSKKSQIFDTADIFATLKNPKFQELFN